MNNEIKEILSYLDLYKNLEEGLLPSRKKKLLLDYITNLQQENERLKEILKWKQNRESELFTIESVLETNKQLYDERNIYKSRIEKTVEILKNTNVDMPSTLLIETIDNGINILNGRSDE